MDRLFWGSVALICLTALLGFIVNSYKYGPKTPNIYEICSIKTCYRTKRYERVYDCIKFIDSLRTPVTLCGYSSMIDIYER